MLLTVVIPMYNEKAIARSCAESLSLYLEQAAAASSFRYEILFSDDGSSDNCGAIVAAYAEETVLEHGAIRVITAEKNGGKGAAVRLGVAASTPDPEGDWVIFTDCDLAYGCEVIGAMFDKIRETGVDVLIGSRAICQDGYEGYTFMRKLASKTYLRLVSLAAGFRHSDSQCGIKMFRGDVGRKIFSLCQVGGWAFDLEVLLLADRMGCRVGEHPVKVIYHRESKVHLLKDSMKMMSEIPKIKQRVKKIRF